MNPALDSLEVFLRLSEEMSEAAIAQDWDKLTEKGNARHALLDALPANIEAALRPEDQKRAGAIMEECQRLDAQTCACVEECQKAMRVLLRENQSIN